LLPEWFVVDNKVFTPGKPITKDLLWVLEQIPGESIAKRDNMEATLRKFGMFYCPEVNALQVTSLLRIRRSF
jgi:predicted metal-dependent peptidase